MNVASLATSVAQAITAMPVSPALVAVRGMAPVRSIEEMVGGVSIRVLPRRRRTEQIGRNSYLQTIGVDIVVQERTGDDDARCEQLIALVESIDAHLRGVAIGDARWFSSESMNDLPIFEDHLREHGLFTSVLAVDYRVDVP